MRSSLADGSGEVSLVVTAYFLGMAAGQLPMGPLSDRFGRRRGAARLLRVLSDRRTRGALAPSLVLLGARFLWGLGAAGPAVIGNAIARDLYSGDQMARVLSLTMAVFLIGPTIAPLLGEVLLLTGVWQAVFLLGFALALVGAVWTFRFGETLPATGAGQSTRWQSVGQSRDDDQPCLCGLHPRDGLQLRRILRLPRQLPADRRRGLREAWLVRCDLCLHLGRQRFLRLAGEPPRPPHRCRPTRAARLRHQRRRLRGDALRCAHERWRTALRRVGGARHRPSTSSTLVSTTAISLALQPMERIAGTAAALRGTFTLGCGSLLASIVDRQIVDTITPMAVGGTIYCGMGLMLLLWARGGSLEVVDPDVA